MRELIVFTEPEATAVEVHRDNGVVLVGSLGTADGRSAWLVPIPDGTEEGWGAWVVVDWQGQKLEQHGALWNKDRNGVTLTRPEFVGDVYRKPEGF